MKTIPETVHEIEKVWNSGGAARIKERMRETWQGIPGLRTRITRIVRQGEWAASEWTLTGTHTGDFPNLPAAGRSFTAEGGSVVQIREGKFVCQRDHYDRAGLAEQPGVMAGGE